MLHGERIMKPSQLLDAILPFHCLLCGAACRTGKALCAGCQQDLPWLGPRCSCCAVPLPGEGAALCGACQHKPPAFDAIHALFHYQPPVDRLVTGFKFHEQLANARLLGTLLRERMQKNGVQIPDLLVPVPLHRQRLRERGFNQALELARPLAKSWRIPLLTDAVHRVRATPAQMLLPAKRRAGNIRGAFVCNDTRVAGQRVGIVDDVVTTGSTVNELARMLRRQGAAQVEVFAIARAG